MGRRPSRREVAGRTQALGFQGWGGTGPLRLSTSFHCHAFPAGGLPSKLYLLWALYSLPTTSHAHFVCVRVRA